MRISDYHTFFQSLCPMPPTPQTTLLLYPRNTRSPSLQGGRFENRSPIPLLGCLVNKPSICCKPQCPSLLTRCMPGNETGSVTGGLNNTLPSQVYVLLTAPGVEMMGKMYISRTGGGWGTADSQSPALRSTNGHCLLMTSSNSQAYLDNQDNLPTSRSIP